MRSLRVFPIGVALLLSATAARASNVTEFPDNGSEQQGRGGAWVARASDPLATTFNPAGLAGQPSRITLQSNVIFQHTCFTRLKAMNDTTQDLVSPGQHYPRVCNDIIPNLNPQIGATLRVTDRLGLGFALIGPSAAGVRQFPEFVNDATGQPQAAPSRYLLVKESGVIVFPTVGVGYEVLDDLRLGASLSWGIAKVKLASATVALNTNATTPGNDVRANLQVADYFVPGFQLGAIWSASPSFDVAAWYKWSDAIRARGDVGTAANYWGKQNAQGNDASVRYGDTIFEDCGTGLPTKACGSGDNASVTFYIPMEAKLGFRYHQPRAVLPKWAEGKRLRDPLATDKWDAELDLTWANNSAADTIQIRFPGDATGKGILPVAGIAGSEIPPNGDQPRGYNDVVGARLGGDYNLLPDRLAIRGGAFVETSAADAQYQSIDFAASARFGLSLGGTYRIRLGQDERSSAIELMLGYGHVFFADQSREDPNASGIGALAGTSCNATTPVSPSRCSDGSLRYRTLWPVNLGTITNSINVINVGLAYRF
jgi:long-subunit fatty acid transport protein